MSIVPVVDTAEPRNAPAPWTMVCAAAAVGLVAAFLFSAFPSIDLAVSRLFFLDDGTFLFATPGFGATVRLLLRVVFGLVAVGAAVSFVALSFFNRKLMGVGLAVAAYMALCAAVGPGLVANLVFKDHWGRARPVHVTEFGGTKTFTPPMVRTDQCDRNCSFVSGEASNIFVLGFALALLVEPRRRRAFMLGAIAAGSFAGLIRIGGGGHFLSDVVFAGVFMALVARGLAWLVMERWAPHLEDGGRFHQRTMRLGLKTSAGVKRRWHTIRQRRQKLQRGDGPR